MWRAGQESHTSIVGMRIKGTQVSIAATSGEPMICLKDMVSRSAGTRNSLWEGMLLKNPKPGL